MTRSNAPADGPGRANREGRLWPGERPFTDFGQWGYGSLDLRVFDQDAVWCNIAGVTFKVQEMSLEYRTNVLAFLSQHAPYFHLMTVRRRVIEVYADAADGTLDPRDLNRLRSLIDQDPADWVAATPIALALRYANGPREEDL